MITYIIDLPTGRDAPRADTCPVRFFEAVLCAPGDIHLVNVRELLRRNPVLAIGSDRALLQVARVSEAKVFEPGAIAARLGSEVTHVLVVASGQLELYRKNREADTQMLVGVIEAPAILGDAELYAGSPWVVTVRASDQSVVVRIPVAAYDRMVSSDPNIAAGLYRDSCSRHLLAVEIMQVFALQKTENKILRLLMSIAHDGEESGYSVARISQVQLANALGLNPKTVRRHLAALEKQGALERRGAEILLRNERARFGKLGRGFGASWKLARGR